MVSDFNCRLLSTILKVSMSYFTNTCHNTFTVYVPSLITVEFLLFIKSQFTINAQNIAHLNYYTHVKIRSWTVTHIQRFWGNYKWFDRHKHMLVRVSSF